MILALDDHPPAGLFPGSQGIMMIERGGLFQFLPGAAGTSLTINEDGLLITPEGFVASWRPSQAARKRQAGGGALIVFTDLSDAEPCMFFLVDEQWLECRCGPYKGFSIDPRGYMAIGQMPGFESFQPRVIHGEATDPPLAIVTTSPVAVDVQATTTALQYVATTTTADFTPTESAPAPVIPPPPFENRCVPGETNRFAFNQFYIFCNAAFPENVFDSSILARIMEIPDVITCAKICFQSDGECRAFTYYGPESRGLMAPPGTCFLLREVYEKPYSADWDTQGIDSGLYIG
jgi:hypothetical protein